MLEFFFSLNVRAGVPMNALTDSLRGIFGFSLIFDITFCKAFSKTDFENHVSGMHRPLLSISKIQDGVAARDCFVGQRLPSLPQSKCFVIFNKLNHRQLKLMTYELGERKLV
jgi:hypothetical protein